MWCNRYSTRNHWELSKEVNYGNWRRSTGLFPPRITDGSSADHFYLLSPTLRGREGKRWTKRRELAFVAMWFKAHPGAHVVHVLRGQKGGRCWTAAAVSWGRSPWSQGCVAFSPHAHHEWSHGTGLVCCLVPTDEIFYRYIEYNFCSFIFKRTLNFLHKKT